MESLHEVGDRGAVLAGAHFSWRTRIGGFQASTPEYRRKWLKRVRNLGRERASRPSAKSAALATP
ncbi:MAG TPA: hypothetical protein VKU80_11135 [Planctomycetota bacterium]|nr:hypothetical protein [Planctomycetota bacterium]